MFAYLRWDLGFKKPRPILLFGTQVLIKNLPNLQLEPRIVKVRYFDFFRYSGVQHLDPFSCNKHIKISKTLKDNNKIKINPKCKCPQWAPGRQLCVLKFTSDWPILYGMAAMPFLCNGIFLYWFCQPRINLLIVKFLSENSSRNSNCQLSLSLLKHKSYLLCGFTGWFLNGLCLQITIFKCSNIIHRQKKGKNC